MNIKERLAKVSFFPVKSDFSSLDANQRKALAHCVNASDIMTEIYLQQIFSGNPQLYRKLKARSGNEGRSLFQYFMVHGCPWDEFHNDEPFIPGIHEKPKFGSFYPEGMTEAEWNAWLVAYPSDRADFESNYTVIKSYRNLLFAVPYADAYADQLGDAANQLRRAAALLPEGTLKTFLELRATAFRSNDYFESDMAWVDTDGHPFEVTIGPYETYFDGLLGLKASFESFIGLPDKDATNALLRFTPAVPEFDLMLSRKFNFKPKGAAIPLEVIADVVRGGEATFGNVFVAYNLPNDRRVHEAKGSKKVFSRTMMEAKFKNLTLPIAERLLSPNMRDYCTFQNRLMFILGHELAHGLGPSTARINGEEIPVSVPLKELASALEEAKADMLGMHLIQHFASLGLIDAETLAGIVASEVISSFQGWRHGLSGAHERASLIEHNWLRAHDAVRYNSATQLYEIDSWQCLEAMSHLSTELMNLQIAGSYERAKGFMEEWSVIPSELPSVLQRLSDIPIAVSPIWDLSGLR